MKLPRIATILAIAAVALAAPFTHAQTTTYFQIDNTPLLCGVLTTVSSCTADITVTTEDGQPIGPTGVIEISYKSSGYAIGSQVLFPDGTLHSRTVADYGHLTFKNDFLGLGGSHLTPPYLDFGSATFIGLTEDGLTKLFVGTDDQGMFYSGTLMYTYSTHSGCSGGRGGGGCHSTWTITGGHGSITRNIPITGRTLTMSTPIWPVPVPPTTGGASHSMSLGCMNSVTVAKGRFATGPYAGHYWAIVRETCEGTAKYYTEIY